MTYDDILSSNKKNIFILDEEVQQFSIENNSLYVKNIYLVPYLKNGIIHYKWSDIIIININKSDTTIMELLEKEGIFSNNQETLLNFKYSRQIVCYFLEIMNMNTNSKYYDSAYIGSDNRNLQFLNMLFNYESMKHYNYYNLLLKAIDYYGKADYIISIDKNGNLLNKINNIKLKIVDEVLKDEYILTLEYMFPELFKTSSVPKTNY